MTDIHAQQFQTVQQVAETMAVLTQRLSDLRQLVDFMQRSEAMAAELAAHRQVAELGPDRPSLSAQLALMRQTEVTGTPIMNTTTGEEIAFVQHGAGEMVRRTRKTGGGQ